MIERGRERERERGGKRKVSPNEARTSRLCDEFTSENERGHGLEKEKGSSAAIKKWMLNGDYGNLERVKQSFHKVCRYERSFLFLFSSSLLSPFLCLFLSLYL